MTSTKFKVIIISEGGKKNGLEQVILMIFFGELGAGYFLYF